MPQQSKLRSVIQVTSGNFLEMFDFFLYGVYSDYIAKAFFPNANQFASLMATFLSFAAGFAMRPIGALVLGPYIDRVGRRKGLIVTLAIMACGTMLIAFVPGYAPIGLFAPLLVLIGRLLQGFSAGVELGGVSVYLSEMATPGHKGFYVAWQSASQQVAVILAALIGFTINKLMAPADLADWGWRIPFFIGCMIVPLLFALRRSLQETEAFKTRAHHPGFDEIVRTLAANWPLVVGGVGMVVMTTVSFYLITVYTPHFGKDVLQLSESNSLLVTIAVGASNLFWLPIAGAASDRIGEAPDPLRRNGAGARHRLSHAVLARQRAELRQDARRRIVAVAALRLVQWRDGGRADRGDPGKRAHFRVLARLQPRDHTRRLVAGDLNLADPRDRRQRRARLLDELRRALRPGRDTGDLRSPSRGGSRTGRGLRRQPVARRAKPRSTGARVRSIANRGRTSWPQAISNCA